LLRRNLTWSLVLLHKFGGLRFLSKIIGLSVINLRECGGRSLGLREN